MVIGTSLKVEPVASIIERVPYKVPKILINKDPIPNRGFNLQLLGLCDDVVSYLCKCLNGIFLMLISIIMMNLNYQNLKW